MDHYLPLSSKVDSLRCVIYCTLKELSHECHRTAELSRNNAAIASYEEITAQYETGDSRKAPVCNNRFDDMKL